MGQHPSSVKPALTATRSPGAPMVSPSAVQVFGCYLSSIRDRYGLTVDDLAITKDARSRAWFRAYEAGSCQPTPAGLTDLEVAFEKATGGTADLDLAGAFEDFQRRPWSEQSLRLRRRFDLGAPPPSEDLGQDREPRSGGLLEEIEYRTRLLTLAPTLVLVVFMCAMLAAEPWASRGLQVSAGSVRGLVLLVLAGTAATALLLPWIGRQLDDLARRLPFVRTKQLKTRLQKVSKRRSEEEVFDEDPRTWSIPDEDRFVIPEYRTRLRSAALETHLCERLLVISTLAVGLFAPLVGCAIAVSDITESLQWFVPAAAWLLIAARLYYRLPGLAIQLEDLTKLAYGSADAEENQDEVSDEAESASVDSDTSDS